MQDLQMIRNNLANTLGETNFESLLGEKYAGKVRDCYTKADSKEMFIITSDRLSCFDRIITQIPFKGQVLTALAKYWFDKTQKIIPNHIISYPDPNVMFVRKCQIIPLEIVVRGYLTGSGWKDYQKTGQVSGVSLPEGLSEFEKLKQAILTPSTKEEYGLHDQPISVDEILEQKIVSRQQWDFLEEKALSLYKFAARELEKRGLILVDTKYEFGICEGSIILADEIHTLDSSRFWEADTYHSQLEQGLKPVMLDKQNVRDYLIQLGFEGDGEVPSVADHYREEVAQLYLTAYQRLTGESFCPVQGNAEARIAENLKIFLS